MFLSDYINIYARKKIEREIGIIYLHTFVSLTRFLFDIDTHFFQE